MAEETSTSDDSQGDAGTTTAGAAGTATEQASVRKIDNAIDAQQNNTSTNVSSTDSSIIGARLHNPLGDFSSYTYKISLYMITPDSFAKYSLGGKLIPKEFFLIAQSGGINNDTSIDNPRAPGMNLDYYIDNLVIKTALSSKETMSATNSYDYAFQIIEPFGFTFPTKLITAAKAVQAASNFKFSTKESVNALRQQFLLTIRFYGYDKNGKIVDSSEYPMADTQTTDKQAVFERSFPIIISKFNFKLDNKAVVYNIEAKMASEHIVFGQTRGVLKSEQSITGVTVSDALVGGTGASSTRGLEQILNDEQKELSSGKDPQIEIPDVYKFVFKDNSGIDIATLVDKDDFNPSRAPLQQVTSPAGSNDRAATAKPIIEKKRTIQLSSGTPILQCIDQIITQSSYITEALSVIDKEDVNQPVENEDTEKKSEKILSWYNVTPMITKVLGADNKRNTYAYEITYVIQKYDVPYLRTTGVKNNSKYPGPNKRYEYWFTGKNSEIISYEQNYNLLYYMAASSTSSAPIAKKSTTAPIAPVAGNSGDPTGRDSGWFEQVNNIKTFLYSPAEQIKAQIKILGDPDYLMTSTSSGLKMLYQRYYNNQNFTINPTSGQVFIELNFNQVEDYNMMNGLLEPNNQITFWDYPEEAKNKIKGICYNVWHVTSTFSKGVFTQELKVSIPDPSIFKNNNTKPTASQREITEQDNVTGVDNAVGQQAEQAQQAANNPQGNKAYQADVRKIDNATTSADDDKGTTTPTMYTDPYGSSDGAAIMAVAREETSNSEPSFLSKLFGNNAGKGRGAPRNYDTTNKTRGM